MKSPENKTITFLFWSVPGTHADHLWKVRVTVPPSATAETPLVLAAEGENIVFDDLKGHGIPPKR